MVRLHRPSRRVRRLLLAGAAVVGTLVLYGPVIADPYATGFGDYQSYHHNWEAGRVAIENHGELPLWNPFECGGITTFGNPDSQLYHPLFYLSLVLGTTLALKVFLLVHAAIGLAGMYVFARRAERIGIVPSALAAIAWAASGYFAWHCGTGHAGFIPFYLVPWLLLAWRRAQEDLRAAAWVGAILTLLLLGAGVYPFTFSLVLIAFDAALRLRTRAAAMAIARATIVATSFTALLGAIRLLPIIEHLRWFPRLRPEGDSMTVREALHFLVGENHVWPPVALRGHHWTWPEYGAYVGWGVVLLGLAGFVHGVVRRRRALAAGAIVFGALSLGNGGPYSPYRFLHRLPVFDSLQVPSRLLVLFLFYFTLLGAAALHAFVRRTGARPALRRAGQAVAVALLVVVAVDVGGEHRKIVSGKWVYPSIEIPPRREREMRPLHLRDVPLKRERHSMPSDANLPAWNLGTGYCYTGMSYLGAEGLWAGNVPQVRTKDVPAWIHSWSRTTTTVLADLTLERAGRVLFNQTWSPGWTPSRGRLVQDRHQAAIDLPAGRHRISLSYRPRTLWPAVLLSGLGIALFAIVIGALDRDRMARMGALHVFSPSTLVAAAVLLAYLFALR